MTEEQPITEIQDHGIHIYDVFFRSLQDKLKPNTKFCQTCLNFQDDRKKECVCKGVKGKNQKIISLDSCPMMRKEFDSAPLEPGLNIDFYLWLYFFRYFSDVEEQQKIHEWTERLLYSTNKIPVSWELDVSFLCLDVPNSMKVLIEKPKTILDGVEGAYRTHLKKILGSLFDSSKLDLSVSFVINLPSDLVPLTPISQIRYVHGQLCLIQGLISEIDEPTLVPSNYIWMCPICQNEMVTLGDNVKGGSFYGKPIPPPKCSNPSCKNDRNFDLKEDTMRYQGRQMAHIQGFQTNGLPETGGCKVMLFDPHINLIHAGDTVEITGLSVVKQITEDRTKRSFITCFIHAFGVKIIKEYRGSRILTEPGTKEILIEATIDHLEQKGQFIIDEKYAWGNQNHIYYMLGLWLVPITSEPFQSLILPHVLDRMKNLSSFYNHVVYRREKYPKVPIFKRSYYNENTNEIFVSNHGTRYYRITESAITVHDNGEYGVFFLTDIQNQEEINVDVLIKEDKQVSDLREYYQNWEFDDSLLSKEEWNTVLYSIDLSLAYGSIIPSKPLFSGVGGWGTFKTTLFRNKLRFHKNKNAQVFRLNPKDVDSLDVVLAEDDYVVLDNIESMPKEWLDGFAANSTGSENVKRKKYTTSTAEHNKNESWIFTTSMNKPFNRADNESRVFYVLFTKVKNSMFKTDKSVDLFRDPEKLNQFFYQYLKDLQKMLHYIKSQPEESKFRMASFFKVFRAALMALGYSEEKADETMQKFNDMQQSSTKEGNELLTLLIELINGGKLIPNGVDSEGKPRFRDFDTGIEGIPPADFLNLLKAAGYSENPNLRTLGNKLTEINNNLLREGIIFERHETKAHARKTHYRIYNRDNPPNSNQSTQKTLEF